MVGLSLDLMYSERMKNSMDLFLQFYLSVFYNCLDQVDYAVGILELSGFVEPGIRVGNSS